MVRTTTYVHVHADDGVEVKPAFTEGDKTTVNFTGGGTDVTLFLAQQAALDLAYGILARYEVQPV